jgi:hypothetical protein
MGQIACKHISNVSTISQSPNSTLSNDALVSSYIPNASMPTLNFKINFVFLIHPTQTHFFSGVSNSQLNTDANNMLNLINAWFLSSGTIPSVMVPQQISPAVPNPKIQLMLNQVYINTTTLAVANNFFGSSSFYNSFPHDTSTALNLYFYTESNPGVAGSGWADNGKYCGFSMPSPTIGGTYISGTIFNNPRLVWHEIGHALGFLDDHYGGGPLNNDPAFGNYRPSDATYDVQGGNNCSIPTSVNTPTNTNNNLMGGSPCREVLSAKQIAAFHYLVAINKTKKFTQFNNATYPYIPNQGASIKMIFSGTQTLTSLPSNTFDTILIPNKSDISLHSLQLTAKPNAIIIIEPGARLSLQRVSISCANNNAFSWRGIEVWGNEDAAQDQNAQAWLELGLCSITGANTGIYVGRKNNLDEPMLKFGGGIVLAEKSTFSQNKIDVYFSPYRYYQRNASTNDIIRFSAFKNKSKFTRCQFESNGSAIQLKQACIILNRTEGVRFGGCVFNGLYFGTPVNYGIYALSSGFSVEKEDTIQTLFIGFKNAICAKAHQSNLLVNINHARFSGSRNNSILLTNVNYPSINNCRFDLVNYQPSGKPTAGIYLNNCNGYSVESNLFTGLGASNTTVMPSGIYVRQSGPYANSIYNNRFVGLSQAMWIVGQNCDAEHAHTGLIINCNDFINCVYNVGVTKTFRLSEAFENHAGIANVQGVAFTSNETDNVRNTYDVSACLPFQENKYHIDTDNSFLLSSHGSFLGPAFRASSQTNNSCSNSSELVDIMGALPSSTSKSFYCPSNAYKNLSLSGLSQQIADQTQDVDNLSLQISSLTDGGNTHNLINTINSSNDYDALKNMILNTSPYVSDSALITYFSKNGLPVGHVVDVHNANKPVNPKVWSTILALDLSTELLIQLRQQQSVNSLNPLNFLKAKWQLYSTHLGLSYHEKIRRVIEGGDLGSVDSAFSVLSQASFINKHILRINFLISIERYDAAKQLLFSLNTSNDMLLSDYQFLQSEFIEARRSTLSYQKLKQDTVKRDKAIQIRNSGNYLAEGIAAYMLDEIWGITWLDEEKPQPLVFFSPPPPPNPIGISEAEVLSEYMHTYPNPVKNNIHLQYKKTFTEGEVKIKIHNASGAYIKEQVLVAELQTIDISNMASGLYFLSLHKNGSIIGVSKLVKE